VGAAIEVTKAIPKLLGTEARRTRPQISQKRKKPPTAESA
jgi:hypothetical protein